MSNSLISNDTSLRELIISSPRFDSLDENTKEATLEEYRLIIAQSLDQYFLDLKRKNLKVKNTANSWVVWVLGVTDEKPISIELDRLRVAEAGSTAVPDIDSDFAKDKRILVKEYLIRKFGQDRVASVGTLSLLKTKVVLKDVARALGYPYEVQDSLSKTIDEEFGGGSQNIVKETVKQIIQLVTTEETAHKHPKTKMLYEQYPDVFESAVRIEMAPRQSGMHAGAVVITPVPMADCIPLKIQKKAGGEGLITTQLDKNALEELGALKADILGLESLNIIDHTLQLILERTGEKLNLNDIPFNDKKTWDVISEGQTLGSFQICTSGIRNICKEYKPQCIDDLGAIIAIYRPGPLENGMDKEFISRKWGRKEVTYLKPAHKTKPILKDTLGIIVYQEQCMLIAQAVAGYNPAEADVLRKVISKSKKEAMMAERDKFVRGCINHSHLSEKESNELFDLIETFGRYGFNKSHSISYAVLGYQMMYLKVNYPLEFVTAWFNNKSLDKITTECIPEAKRLGLKIGPPDLNRSLVKFTYDPEAKEIVFGLSRIKGCGDAASTTILNERASNGPFTGLLDLFERISGLNKKAVEAIAGAGGFSRLGYRREDILLYLEEIKELVKRKNALLTRQVEHKEKANVVRLGFKQEFQDLEDQLNKALDAGLKKVINKKIEGVKKRRDKAKERISKRAGELLAELDEIDQKLAEYDQKMKGKETLKEIIKYEFESLECHISAHPLDDPIIGFMRKHIPKLQELDEVLESNYPDSSPILFASMFKAGKETIAKRSGKPMFVMNFEGRVGSTVSRKFGTSIPEYKSKLIPGEIYIINGTWSSKFGVDIKAIKSLNNFFRTTFAELADKRGIDISSLLV